MNKFSQNNYDGNEKLVEQEKNSPTQKNVEEVILEDNVDKKDTKVAKNKDNKKAAGIKSVKHQEVRDIEFARLKTIKLVTFISAAVVVLAGIIVLYFLTGRVQVIDLAGKDVTSARTWAVTNDITLDEEMVYSDEEASVVLSQSIESGEKIFGGTVIEIQVSQGPDPQEIIEVLDFESANAAEIQDWIDENQLSNTNLIQEYSEVVETGEVIEVEYRDAGVSKDNFKRSDYLTITVSKGAEQASQIVVLNFVGSSLTETQQWAYTNSINLKVTYVTSTEMTEGIIISQGTSGGTSVDKNSTVEITVSAGEGILVPDYSLYTIYTASQASSEVYVITQERYSDSVAYGKLVSQSSPANSRVLSEDNKITVTYSLGKPYITSLVGKNSKDLEIYFFDLNSKGASISYSIEYVESSVTKGIVVGASKSEEYLNMTDSVVIYLSDGSVVE